MNQTNVNRVILPSVSSASSGDLRSDVSLTSPVTDGPESGVSYQCTDKVTVLGLVCGKMTERVMMVRQEMEDSQVRQSVDILSTIVDEDDTGEEEGKGDEGDTDEREIWEVTHITEEDWETTEGEDVDLLVKLLEMVGWSDVNDKDTEKE